jgi:type I restriction enzyme S subunit
MDKPKIRFKGYTDAWEQRKFGDLGSVSMCKRIFKEQTTMEGEIPFYKIGTFGGEADAFISRELFEEYKEKFQYPKVGDMLISASGTIGRTVEYKGEEAYFQDSNIVWFNHDERIDNSFLKCVYSFVKWSGIEGSTIKRLYNDNFLKTEFCMPTIEEQRKIGGYFSTLDHLITLHQRKCEQTQKLKKYMLQKMFPQNGENFPEIRFDGFTDAWEQRKFGDLADYKKGPFGSAITKDMFVSKSADSIKVYEQQNAINKDWKLERYFLPREYVLTKLKSFEVHGGDVIVSCAGTIGEIYEIPENAESGVINQALMRVRVEEDIADKKMFIIAFSNMINSFTRTHSNGSAIKNIPPFADLKTMEALVPSMPEQKMISSYFSTLDHLITLHQRKCAQLQNIKKFMLQNMFL